MAKNSRSASTGRSTSKSAAKSTATRASKSKSMTSKSTPSKSTASKSAASKSASKALVKGASKSITRSARTGRSTKTTAPTALAGGTTRTSRRAPLTTVTENVTTRVRARSAVPGPVKVKRPQVRQVKVRTPQVREVDIAEVDLEGVEVGEVSVLESVIATVRGAVPQLRVDTLGTVERTEIHRLNELVTDAEEITVVGEDNRQVPVAGALLKALATVMGALDRGATVTVTEADQLDTELTSQEAADLLNVSRPYVVKLAREGVLPHHRVGNRHRFTLTDVLEHRARMRATTEEALAELAPADGYTAADF